MISARDQGTAVSGRTFAIGDIHGCHIALEVLLAHIEPTAADTIVVLGDVVDRGPGSKQAVDQLLQLQQTCKLVFIMGNHEEMMLEAVAGGPADQDWLVFGGRETMESYGNRYDLIPQTHLEFLQAGINFWETDSDIFIHANLEPGVELPEQTAEWLRWTRLTGFEYPHPSGKRVLCGHSTQRSGLPLIDDGWVCLDTWVYGDGWLTCLDVDNDVLHQTRQDGSLRHGVRLNEL